MQPKTAPHPQPRETAEGAARETAAPAPGDAGRWGLPGLARLLRVDPGLHVLTIGAVARADAAAGLDLPATNLSALPAEAGSVEIAASSGNGRGWIGAEGGTAVLKVRPRGGTIVVTTYGISEAEDLPDLRVVPLDEAGGSAVSAPLPQVPAARSAATAAVPEPTTSGPQGRDVPFEMITHVERQGDRRVVAEGWIGSPERRLRIEGFAVRPLETLAPGDVEYMGFGLLGRQTPWVTDGRLCGTRGRALPLTGFAVRLAPGLRDRFDVVYEGCFLAGGISAAVGNGTPCLSATADDPLVAIRLRIVERQNS